MIEGIEIFERIEVYGKQTPSDATILIILFELKKTENKNDMTNANSAISQKFSNFLDTSNLAVKHTRALFNNDYIEFTASANMGLDYKNNYQSQCELIGVSFPLLWQSFATISWFASVMNYLEIPNQSDMSKDMIKHANTFKKTGAYVRDSRYTDDKNNLIRFKEYREAISFIYEFISGTSELSKNNQQMKELLIQRDNILREIAKVDVLTPYRICRFCMSVFNVRTSSDKWKSCGSPDCKKAYIRANRQKNHPKRQWVHDPTALKPCVGECGSNRKKLNSERICFCCYKPFS
jgi:hypothetical protein